MRLAKHITLDMRGGSIVVDEVLLDFYVRDDIEVVGASKTEMAGVRLTLLAESVHVLNTLQTDIAQIVDIANRHRVELGLPKVKGGSTS